MSVNSPSSEATPASSAAASSVSTSAKASLFGIPPDRLWTGTIILVPIPPPYVLLANRAELEVRNVTPTDLVSEVDYFRDLGYPETEIAGIPQAAAQRVRVATEKQQ